MESIHPTNLTIREKTPLADKDCFFLSNWHKTNFTYPLHTQDEYEGNFMSNASGVKKNVSDSDKIIDDDDLVLIANGSLKHVRVQNTRKSGKIRDITIQFLPDLFLSRGYQMRQFESIFEMLDKVTNEKNCFYALTNFLSILYELSQFNKHVKVLASNPVDCEKDKPEDIVIWHIKNFINENYKSEIRLKQLAHMPDMPPTAFCRFFKQEIGMVLSDYIINLRLNNASRLLIGTTMPVSNICYECSFNNLSNFNRTIQEKNCSPKELRESCHKKKLIFFTIKIM